MNLTPEYPPEVKPERVGVYLTRLDGDPGGYSYWDGMQWRGTFNTPIAAHKFRRDWGVQNKHWQGLASDPGKRAVTLDEFRANLAEALCADCENGVRYLNERAVREFDRLYPNLSKALKETAS